jgi:DNA-binding response OmpR family regulator
MFGLWGHKGKRSPSSGALQKSVILVVEDDPELRGAMSRHLANAERFCVLAADNYHTAIKHLEAGTPHIACVDLGLPNESGYELCEYMRRQPALAYVPVIVTGENSSPKDMAQAEDAGANAFLAKPFTMQRLAAVANELLGGAPMSCRGARLLRIA